MRTTTARRIGASTSKPAAWGEASGADASRFPANIGRVITHFVDRESDLAVRPEAAAMTASDRRIARRKY